ncbi:MAG TPA: helix-turn-helix domain-containing protein [Thermoanaerobaculia bacterium]|nr:helix-turn-helix domain-containing protein [Thermoanaerobaculia bacterium]
MDAEHLLARFQRNAEVQRQLLRFTNAFITQVSQTAACNRAHDMEARFARWLLMMQDRVAAPQIRMTQQFLAHMLGARTASVNEAVQKLEAAGASDTGVRRSASGTARAWKRWPASATQSCVASTSPS